VPFVVTSPLRVSRKTSRRQFHEVMSTRLASAVFEVITVSHRHPNLLMVIPSPPAYNQSHQSVERRHPRLEHLSGITETPDSIARSI
jgi:hypothetical protein